MSMYRNTSGTIYRYSNTQYHCSSNANTDGEVLRGLVTCMSKEWSQQRILSTCF